MSASARLAGLLASLCALLSLATPARAEPSGLAFAACPSTQVVVHAAGLQCATLDVPFDRGNPALGDVALAVQRVPASAARVGAIVLLAGGPGQPALGPFEALLAPLAREAALRGFELVAFDQRGTGQSQGLQCPVTGESFNGGLPSYLGACGAALGPTRAFYTSQESVEDLDALRQGLGGSPLSLFAVSYGTRVAGMYAREHPQGIARMVLDSPVPLTGGDPLGRERLHALRRVLDVAVCGAGACRSFTQDAYADLARVVTALHRHPLRTRIYDAHGRLRRASVTEVGVLRLLSGLDITHGARELAPAAFAAAAHGDAEPLARLTQTLQFKGLDAAPAPEVDSETSLVLFAATSCVEDLLPWSPDSPPAARPGILRSWLASQPGTTAPFAPATVVASSPLALCAHWPATPPAPPSPAGDSATPTLILSGADDLRTPYEQALAIAATYSDSHLLQVPAVGHSSVSTDQTGCARRAMIAFLAAGQAPASCPASNEAQALPLPPSSLGEVPPAASSSRLAGRVAAAATMTLEDLLGQTGFSGGGLRGGYWTLRPHGFALHGMIDVPGVALSGTIRVEASSMASLALTARLTVRGRLSGKLRLRGRALSGRIGGAFAHARLAAP